MSRVVFVGAYGLRSQGDDAALLYLCDALGQRLKSFEGYVITRHASENPYEEYGLHSVQNIEYDTKAESAGRWFRGLNYDDDQAVLENLVEVVRSSQLMVIGAGNAYIDMVIDVFRGPVPYCTLMSLIARMNGVPYMLYGVTVGPLDTDYGRRLTYLSADLAAAVTVRDARSAEWFRELGYAGEVIQLPDPVMGLRVPEGDANGRGADREGGPVLGVSVRDVRSIIGEHDNEKLMDNMAQTTRLLVEELDATVRFIPHCTYAHANPWDDDREVARGVVSRLGVSPAVQVVEEDLSVPECLALYRDLDGAIGMRLHSNVYAAMQGVPNIAVDYNPKVASFMSWLGADDRVVSVGDLRPEGVVRRVVAMLEDGERISRSSRERVDAGAREVQVYADIAARLAEQGR